MTPRDPRETGQGAERDGDPYRAIQEMHAFALRALSSGRAYALRLALFRMRDAREVTSAAGYTLTTEAKARLYDIQQDIIRAAIDADDSALREGQEGKEQKSESPSRPPLPATGAPTCALCLDRGSVYAKGGNGFKPCPECTPPPNGGP